MPTPFRSALVALTGATVLVTASCSSSSEATPSTGMKVTASAWVAPAKESAPSLAGDLPSSPLPSPDSTGAVNSDATEAVPDPYVTVEPFPAGISEADRQQAQAAVDTYSRYWSLTNRLGANPNVDSATQIAGVATGTAARELEKSFERFRERGYRITGQNSVAVTVQRVEAGAVDLSLCVDGSDGRVIDSVGAPVDDDVDKSTRRPGFARVGQYVGGWKVDTNTFDMGSSC